LAASTLPGLVNYALIVFLAYSVGNAGAGEYRIFYSIFAITGIVTLLESGKIVVRGVSAGDPSAIAAAIAARIFFVLALAPVALVLSGLAYWMSPGMLASIDGHVVAAIGFGLLHFITDSWMARLQAEERFGRVLALAVAKHAGSLAVFAVFWFSGAGVPTAALAQFAAMTLFNVVAFMALIRPLLKGAASLASPRRVLARPEASEALTLSAATALPNALEHLDKFVIGAVFGLEAVGLYTLCVSTGRLLYNGLKPALYIYYRRFTLRLPSGRALTTAFVAFTLFGVLCAAAFYLAVANIGVLARFRGGEAIATAVFLAYGVAMADSILTQAYAINAQSRSGHLFLANLIAGTASLGCYGLLIGLPVASALIGFAAVYGFRHAVTLVVLLGLRRRQISNGAPT
jgi:O-antigen/teichoic acid export membrane protein